MIFEKNPSRCNIFNMCFTEEEWRVKMKTVLEVFLQHLPPFWHHFLGTSLLNSTHHHKQMLLPTEARGSCKRCYKYIRKKIHSLPRTDWDPPTKKIAGLTAFDPCSSSLGHQLCQATQAADGLRWWDVNHGSVENHPNCWKDPSHFYDYWEEG